MKKDSKWLVKLVLCLSLVIPLAFFKVSETQAATTERYKFVTHAWSLPAKSTVTLFSVTAPVGEAFVAAVGTNKDPNWPESSSASSSILLQRTAPVENYPNAIPYTVYGIKMDGTRINLKNGVANYNPDYSGSGGKAGWELDYRLGELPSIVSIHIEATNTSNVGLNFAIPDSVANSGRGSTYYSYITLTRESKAVLAPSEYAKLAAERAAEARDAALENKKQIIQSETNITNKLNDMEGNLKTDFNNRISLAENNITKKLGDVESNLKTDITNMGTSINNKLGDMESNLKTDITNLGSDINKKLANINTSIVNMQSSNPPTLIKVAGYNKATATKNSTFKVAITYSGANEYRWKLDGGEWSSWTSLTSHDQNGYFTASGVSGTGTHTVMVEIRQASTVNDPGTGKPTPAYSPVAKGQFSFFKL